MAPITPDDLVRWRRRMQRLGLSTWSIRHAWAPHRRAAGGGDRSVRLPIATAVFSGLRLGELLGLTWEDTDFKGGALKVHFQMTRQGERRP